MPNSKIEKCTSTTDIWKEKTTLNLPRERRKGFMEDLGITYWFYSLLWSAGPHIQPSLGEGQFQGCFSWPQSKESYKKKLTWQMAKNTGFEISSSQQNCGKILDFSSSFFSSLTITLDFCFHFSKQIRQIKPLLLPTYKNTELL